MNARNLCIFNSDGVFGNDSKWNTAVCGSRTKETPVTRLRMMMLEELQRAATTCEITTRTYLQNVTAFANFDAFRQTKKHNQWL